MWVTLPDSYWAASYWANNGAYSLPQPPALCVGAGWRELAADEDVGGGWREVMNECREPLQS